MEKELEKIKYQVNIKVNVIVRYIIYLLFNELQFFVKKLIVILDLGFRLIILDL